MMHADAPPGGSNNCRLPLRTPPRTTAATVESLTRSLSPFTAEGLRRLSLDSHLPTLNQAQIARMQRNLLKAKTLLSDVGARNSCNSLCAGNTLAEHELLLAIRFLFLLDGATFAKVDADGKIPEVYYDLVACLHCIHNRYSFLSPAQSESHHP